MSNNDKKENALLTPVKLGDLELRHRVVMAPLTRVRSKQPGNIPQELNVEYYKQRASEGGLLISEATQVSQGGQAYPRTPGIHSKEQIEGWKQVVNAVHSKKGLIALQLWHTGRVSHSSYQPDGRHAVGPSEVAVRDGLSSTADGKRVPYETPRSATKEDIKLLIEEFKAGAENAKAAGFDGVEVHGANGYLITQFLEDNVNKRTDEYGGSFENRARFLFEVLDVVIAAFGNSRRVGIRLSPWSTFNDVHDSNKFDLYAHVLSRLSKYDLAYVHIVEPSSDENSNDKEAESIDVKKLKEKAQFKGNVIVCNGHTRESGGKSVESGVATAVAYGRLFIANPDLPKRFLLEKPLNVPNPNTFYSDGQVGYTDYPFLE